MSENKNITLREIFPDKRWLIQTIVLSGIYTAAMCIYQPMSTIVANFLPSNALAEKIAVLDQTMDDLGIQEFKPARGKK